MISLLLWNKSILPDMNSCRYTTKDIGMCSSQQSFFILCTDLLKIIIINKKQWYKYSFFFFFLESPKCFNISLSTFEALKNIKIQIHHTALSFYKVSYIIRLINCILKDLKSQINVFRSIIKCSLCKRFF